MTDTALPATTTTSTTFDGSDLPGRVRAVLRAQFGAAADALPDDGPLAGSAVGYDSLSALELVSRVEAEFGLEVDFVGHDVRHWFATPGRIAEFVERELEDRAATGGRP